MNSPKPISCDQYDQLEIVAMRAIIVDIRLNDGSEFLNTKITNLYTKEKIEYLSTLEGEIIALHTISEIKNADGIVILKTSSQKNCPRQ